VSGHPAFAQTLPDYLDVWGVPGVLVVGGVEYPVTIAISRDMDSGPVGGRTTERPRWTGRVASNVIADTGASVGSVIRTERRNYAIAGIDPRDDYGLQTLKLVKE